MPSKKTRASVRTRSAKPAPLPFGVLALSALIGTQGDPEDVKMWRRALEVAKKRLIDQPQYPEDEMLSWVQQEAEAGVYGDSMRRAMAVDPGNITGDLLNGIGGPALRVGLCLAYLVLTHHGGGAR